MPSREAVIATAQAYVQRGLVGHDWPKVPLAKDCHRTEWGWSTGVTDMEIHQTSAQMIGLGGVRMLKWLVQGSEGIAFFELAVPGGRIVHIGEYFRISGDKIREIRPTLNSPGMPGNGVGPAQPLRPAPRPVGNPAIGIVAGYLAAIKKGDLNGAKLGPDVIVTENGEVKANRLEAVTKHLTDTILGKVQEITVWDWVAEGNDVAVSYRAEMIEGRPLWYTQYFRIYDGLIRETFANFGRGPTRDEMEKAYGKNSWIAPTPKAAPKRRAPAKRRR